MKTFLSLFFSFSCLLFSNEKTFIREYTYIANWKDTKETARRVALNEVKAILLEEVGVYISSELNINTKEILKEGRYEIDETFDNKLTSITAGITKTKIIDQTWKKKLGKSQYWMKAKITLNPDDIQNKIKDIVNNKKLLKDLEENLKKNQKARAQIKLLNKNLDASNKEKENLKFLYEKEIKKLKTSHMFDKAANAHINGEYDNAISLYSELLEFCPTCEGAYYKLVDIYTKLGNHSKIIETMKRFIEDADIGIMPEDFETIAESFYNLGNGPKAIEFYNKAAAKDVDFMTGYFYTPDDNIDTVRLSEYAKKVEAEYATKIGHVYYALDTNYSKAIESYYRSIELNPSGYYVPDNYYFIGQAYFAQDSFLKVITSYNKCMDLEPGFSDDFLLNYQLGFSYAKQGDYPKAISLYKKAIELDPNYFEVYYYLGNVHSKQGNYSKAIDSYEKVIELDPNSALGYARLGDAYYYSNFDKALIYYKKAARLGHKSIQNWLKQNSYDY